MKAAVYLRVSSRDGRQDEANQEPACLRVCEARGWQPIMYQERESGGVRTRPVWRSVMEAARRGEVRAVVVWSLDRIGRNREQITHDVDELLRWRVEVVSVQEGWVDQAKGTDAHELLMQMTAWVAAGFRKRLSENTKAGQARARARGKRIGRPPSIPAAVLDRAEQLAFPPPPLPGLGERAVAARIELDGLGRWSPAGIARALARRRSTTPVGAVVRRLQNGVVTEVPNPAPDAGLGGNGQAPTN